MVVSASNLHPGCDQPDAGATYVAPTDFRAFSAASTSQFRTAAEAGRIATWELDLSTGAFSASSLFNDNLGVDRRYSMGWDDLRRAVHPEDIDRRQAALDRSIATGADYDIEYRIVRSDGNVRWLQFRGQVARDDDGRPARLMGVSFDVTERRAAELRMELSEESLRLAAEAAEVGTWDVDLTTNALNWSARTKAMFGISPDVPCTMDDFYSGLHPDDRAATVAAFESALDPAVRAIYDVEYRTVGKEDGVLRWVAAKGKGLFYNGECRRAIGTAIDITSRKIHAARQAFLLHLVDELRTLSDPASIMVKAVRALGEHLGACRAGYGQVRSDDDTIQLETCYVDGVDPVSGELSLQSFGAHNVDRQRQGHTLVINDTLGDPRDETAAWADCDVRSLVSVPLVRDGRLRATVFINHPQPYRWSQGDVALIEEVAGRTWDALERARAEAALRQLNASLERQVEMRTRELNRTWRLAPLLMLVAGSDGALLKVNPAWSTVLGWTVEETIGRELMEFVAPEDHEAGTAGMALLLQGRPMIDYQITFMTKAGDRRHIVWTTVPEGGHLYAYGRDVTEQMLAEDRLRHAQKMEAVGQLTGGLAHDFNNLLTGIIGNLELMETRVSQGRTNGLAPFINGAQGSARRAAALTQRLLAFSRRQTLAPKTTDVNSLIAGLDELIRHTVGPRIEIGVAAEPRLWATLVDPHQLENALLNLCINARDAMPEGGRMTIETGNTLLEGAAAQELELTPGAYLWIQVSDTGSGMSPDVMRRAFDPFFTTKPLGAGTGLGLSMIYGFARQSGGQARIISAVGRGTNVRIYLPRHDAAVPEIAPPPASITVSPADAGETVLVVDDDAVVRTLVVEVLEQLGYMAIEAGDAAGGMRVLQSGARVDLLVSDVGLPGGMNGRQLADAGRTIRPALPVLFITGYAENAALHPDQLEPGMEVVTKPFGLEMLAGRVRSLLATYPAREAVLH